MVRYRPPYGLHPDTAMEIDEEAPNENGAMGTYVWTSHDGVAQYTGQCSPVM